MTDLKILSEMTSPRSLKTRTRIASERTKATQHVAGRPPSESVGSVQSWPNLAENPAKLPAAD